MDKIKFPVPKNVLLLFVLGIGLLVLGNVMTARQAAPTARVDAVAQPAKSSSLPEDAAALKSYRESLAQEAERVIGQVRGAGRVTVSVALSSGPETVLAGNQNKSVRRTEEKESGVSRVVEETTDSAQPVIARQSSGDHPLVTRIVAPQVDGVIVVASGAADPRVRAEVTRAAQVMFNVPAHRVRVLTMEGR